jgi:NAD(P)-dependent dehydrogenase (short-subunit alcohol dehydrogenase family)
MTTSLFDLTGKTALVSGASRGIGEETARLLAEHGAHVTVSSRRLDDCRALADSIRDSGGSADAFACNVGKMDDIAALFVHLRESGRGLDICFNNAATQPYFGHVLDTDLGAFNKTFEVNVRGYFFTSIEAGKMMRDQRRGVIVNTASVSALKPSPNQAVYSMTKAAVVNMTKAFARECGPLGIRCNALLPGLTRTKFAGGVFSNDDFYNEVVSQVPLGRHAEPREMAGTVLYLVSEAGSYTNGECIVVDGGMTV